jgi:unsaturated rhamnogalacturonyl hydrolase
MNNRTPGKSVGLAFHILLFALLCAVPLVAQTTTNPAAPATPPAGSHLTAPAYPTPYAPASPEEIKAVLDRVLAYLETAAPVRIIDRDTGQPVSNLAPLPANPGLDRTDFPLISYEWGVTYSGMLLVAEVTGDNPVP